MIDTPKYCAYNAASTWGTMFARALKSHGEQVAVVDSNRSWTYRQLSEHVSCIVQSLEEYGLEPGDAVGLLGINSTDLLATLIATQLLGLRYTPLHPLGGIEDHKFALEDAQLGQVIVDPRSHPAQCEFIASQSDVNLLTLGSSPHGTDLLGLASRHRPDALRSQADPNGRAAIFYTGGTTGRPKGVVLPQRVFSEQTLMCLADLGWPTEPRTLLCTPFSHAACTFLLATLHRGGTLVLRERFEPSRFLDDIERYRINVSWLVPTMIYLLADAAEEVQKDLSSLEMLVYGGGPISSSQLERALRIFGPVFQQVYGQTETFFVSTLRPADHDPDRTHLLASCGRPLAGVDVAILDPESAEPVAVGEIGEIAVRSSSTFQEYWQRPDLTESATRRGWKTTGDVGRIDEDGYIYLVDRTDDVIVSGGFNVYPRFVEDALSQHPAVALSAAFGIPDDRWNEAVTAAVVLRAEATATEQELRDHVKKLRGSVSAPKRIVFCEDLPLTAVGKVNRRALREPYWAGATRNI